MKQSLLTILFILAITLTSIAANRYWVGGSDTWNSTAGSKWSTTSGGSGGASVPGTGDIALFDANSGSVTVSLGMSIDIYGIDFTGFTGTFNGDSWSLEVNGGDITLGSGMTFGTGIASLNISGNCTITSNGIEFEADGVLLNTAHTLTLGDAMTMSGPGSYMYIYVSGSTLNTNDNNLTVSTFYGLDGTLDFGSSTITMTYYGNDVFTVSNAAITEGTYTIRFSNTSNNALIAKFGNSQTYNNVLFDRGASTGTITIEGNSNTFNNFYDYGTAAHTIVFPNTTTTVADFDVGGEGFYTTLSRTGGSGTWTLASTGANQCIDWVIISNSTATGATWYAGANSTNSGGNTGWYFLECDAPVNTNKSKHFFKP